MLPITLANLQNFCRVCLRDISNESAECNLCEVKQTKRYLPNRLCSNCNVKLCALRKFRCKAITAIGVLRIIVDEERLKSTVVTKSNAILPKLQSICRICFKGQNLESFSARDKIHANDIFECTGLKILKTSEEDQDVLKDDPCFPDGFCNKCYTTIKSFIEFRNVSKQTADYLKNVFDEHETSYMKSLKEENQKVPAEDSKFVELSKLEYRDVLASVGIEVEHRNRASPENKNLNFEGFSTKRREALAIESESTEKKYFSENVNNDLYVDNKSSCDEVESTDIFIASTACKQTLEKVCSVGTKSTRTRSKKKCTLVSSGNVNINNLGQLKMQDNIEIRNEKEKDLVEDSFLDKNARKIKKQRTSKTFQKAFKCVECSKSFYKKFMYEAHIRSVHENIEKPFSCPHCKTSFRLVQVLHRHISCCHANIADNRAVFDVPRKQSHICLLCQNTFKRREHLKEHIRAVHEKLKPYECGVCGKAFGTKNTQMRHEKNHSNDKPFSCEYCAKRYNSESELKVHLQRHTSNPELLCPICKRAKQTIEELQNHISMHKSSYQCTTCGKIFKKLFHLREHENTVHLKLRSLKCSYCDMTFTIRKTLKNHEKSHDAIGRPEKCPLCELNFKSKRALTLHSKKVHFKES